MDDSAIVDLYLTRDESAIDETEQNTEAACARSHTE